MSPGRAISLACWALTLGGFILGALFGTLVIGPHVVEGPPRDTVHTFDLERIRVLALDAADPTKYELHEPVRQAYQATHPDAKVPDGDGSIVEHRWVPGLPAVWYRGPADHGFPLPLVMRSEPTKVWKLIKLRTDGTVDPADLDPRAIW